VMAVISEKSTRFALRRKPGAASALGLKPAAAKMLREINALARQLRARRFAAGALDIEIPEVEVSLDGEGMMTGLELRPSDESHQMIEECMVAANEAVAKELWTHGVKIIARRHEAPDPEKLLALRQELAPLGIKTGNLENPKVFAQFLQTIKKSPLYPTLAVMVLRSMKRAVYDASDMGHWGLAKRFYSHFTSPIRRYPDLLLHRQLAAYLADPRPSRPPALADWARHATEMEERAAEAERSLVEIKKYRLLEDELRSRTPVEYDAVISRCERFGCFVEVPAIAASGLVHIALLSRRFVRYNASDRSLSAPGGGSWRVGDRLKVVIARVDFDNRRLDFAPADLPRDDRGDRNGGETRRTGREKRGLKKKCPCIRPKHEKTHR